MRSFGYSIVFVFVLFASVAGAYASEISLFSADGSAIAYVADDLTIYLWGGKPVAYLRGDPADRFDVYGFNGRHLGWYSGGVLYDHAGFLVGARKEAFSTFTKLEPIKGIKQIKPIKAIPQIAPVAPIFVNQWSREYLDEFLLQGSR